LLSGVPPRSADPHLRERIIDTAARLLATEGAVSARRLARELGTAGEAVWSGVHGHTTLELTGFFGAVDRDPVRSYSEILTRMSIGLGDDTRATARSLSTARRRSARADRAEAASAREALP
jgi:hypothetical protein